MTVATPITPPQFVSETHIISTAGIFKLDVEGAMDELNNQLRVYRVYARAKNHKFLAYLLDMAEMEARRLGDQASR